MHKHQWRLVQAMKMIDQPPTVEYQCRTCGARYTTHTGEEPSVLREDIMPIINKPKPGDTVEVTIRGVVTSTAPAGFHIRTDKENDLRMAQAYRNFYYEEPALVSVTIIRRAYWVGNIINRNDIMTWNPPSGTVIIQDGISWMKIDRGMAQWVDSTGTYAEPSAMPSGNYRIEVIMS